MPARSLTDDVKAEALRLGFAAVGVTTAEPFARARDLALRAIDEGRMDGMPWYTRERVVASADLRGRYDWARSIVALAWPYAPAASPRPERAAAPGPNRGRVAAYACLVDADRPTDYHTLLADRCAALEAWLRAREPSARAKHFVDHGWALDRAIAERAGIGFSGKNTTLITRAAGSYVLLAAVVTSLALEPDGPTRKGCGTCRACLPACPTGALLEPGVIDAPRCIAYLTIEHRGPIPEQLRPLIGDWAFGCDLCQEACPINERLAPAALPPASASTRDGPVPYPDLVECLGLDDAAFDERFRGTAVHRTGRAGLARNCAIALGNVGTIAARQALTRAALGDPDAVVREAAAWALRRLEERASAT